MVVVQGVEGVTLEEKIFSMSEYGDIDGKVILRREKHLQFMKTIKKSGVVLL